MTNLNHSIFLSARKWLENNQNFWTRIWIGVNDMNEEGNFVNMLNETVNYTNWAPDEPNNAIPFDFGLWNDSDCVMIKSGKWNDTPCSRFYSYPALCSQRYNITLTTGKCSECQCNTPKSYCTIACKIHRVTFKLLS